MRTKPIADKSLSEDRDGIQPVRFRVLAICLAIATAFLAAPLSAQTIYWNNTSNSNAWFQVSSNWTPPISPNPSSHVAFIEPGAYTVWWDQATAATSPTVDRLTVAQGNVFFLNQTGAQLTELAVNNELTIAAALTLRGIYLHGHHNVDISGALALDSVHPAGSRLTLDPFSRLSIDGSMHVSGPNAAVIAWDSDIGENGAGSATITDGAIWNNQTLGVGGYFDGTLNVLAGGSVSSVNANVGQYDGSHTTAVTISGSGSQWTNTGDMSVQGVNFGSGSCSLEIAAGGLVSSHIGRITDADVTVTGNGSVWNITNALRIGFGSPNDGRHNGDLYIQNGGKVTVGGTTGLRSPDGVWRGGIVHISGATSRFEFGRTSLAEFERIDATGGSLAGDLVNSSYARVTDFATSMSQDVNIEEVRVLNSGTLYGDGSIRLGLNNTASGEVETIAGERMRFAGNGTNAGQINIFGGQVRFAGSFLNDVGGEVNNFGNSFVANQVTNLYGFISGRGQFVANNGWYNQGVMAFSDGNTDIHGDVTNSEGALIVTSGNGTTTFYDDFYQENAGELRTSAGSSTVFFGEVSGGGNYTGTGTVFMEGDLRPGNSPGTMSFGGDLVLSPNASTFIELGGLDSGDFDRLLINGDLFLGDSQLNVVMWNGFLLGDNMQFLVAEIEGERFGNFANLSEGALVGNFGGQDLFITYQAGSGNDIGFFTAIPEPSSAGLFALFIGVCWTRRRGANRRQA